MCEFSDCFTSFFLAVRVMPNLEGCYAKFLEDIFFPDDLA